MENEKRIIDLEGPERRYVYYDYPKIDYKKKFRFRLKKLSLRIAYILLSIIGTSLSAVLIVYLYPYLGNSQVFMESFVWFSTLLTLFFLAGGFFALIFHNIIELPYDYKYFIEAYKQRNNK